MRISLLSLALAIALTSAACTGSQEGRPKASSARPSPAPTASPASAGPEIGTSSWREGDGGRMALIGGVLHFTSRGCPYIGGSHPTWVVWPANFSVDTYKKHHRYRLLTADGRAFTDGTAIQFGGAATGLRAGGGKPCIPPGVYPAVVESTVTLATSRLFSN
ncbi:hypothetical protein [Nocardioides panacisoli]|uniref:Uncharacterized protein n=1 Tax=Nocardioides panacisoli TaxID=627624 RepID=A0ABP7ITK0_9ACTN